MNKHKYSIIFVVFGSVSLFISCVIVSNSKLFWMDELITYYLVSDKSLLHMLYAIADQVDSSPPFYHIILHLWSHIFGSSELALRLFSSLMMVGSLIFLYYILKKIFGIYETVIALIFIYFINNIIFYHNSEARFYALFLFEFTVLLFLHMEIIFNSKRYYFILVVVQVIFILTHPFGILYSFCLLICSSIYFSYTKFNYRLIISNFGGWLISLIYLPVFLNQIKVGEPHFWINSPSYKQGLKTMIADIIIVPKWMILIISLIGMSWFINIMWRKISSLKKNNSKEKYDNEKIFIYLLSFGLVVIPICVFAYSIIFTPLLEKRYMIISEIAWGVILCALLNNYKTVFEKNYLFTKYKFIMQLFLMGLVLVPIVKSIYYNDLNRNEITVDIKTTKKKEYLVLLSPHKYLPRHFYSTNRSSFLFVIDAEIANRPDNIKNASVDLKLMKALKRNYPIHNIVTNSYLIDSLNSFIVRNEDARLWFNQRIVGNPKFEYHERYENVYDVKRKISVIHDSKHQP